MVLRGCWRLAGARRQPAPTPRPPSRYRRRAEPEISLVTSVVVVEACPDSKKHRYQAGEPRDRELVGPCKKVPGGAAHFAATLHAGWTRSSSHHRRVITTEGIVPTCLLQKRRQLKHKLQADEGRASSTSSSSSGSPATRRAASAGRCAHLPSRCFSKNAIVWPICSTMLPRFDAPWPSSGNRIRPPGILRRSSVAIDLRAPRRPARADR